MSRLIDADKLKKHYAWWKGGTREMTMDEAKSDFDTIIDLQPTVEPTASTCLGCNCPKMEKLEADPTKHGRWETTRPDAPMFGFYYCSVCGRKRTSPQDNYCPNCGSGNCFDNYCGHCGAKLIGTRKDSGENGSCD